MRKEIKVWNKLSVAWPQLCVAKPRRWESEKSLPLDGFSSFHYISIPNFYEEHATFSTGRKTLQLSNAVKQPAAESFVGQRKISLIFWRRPHSGQLPFQPQQPDQVHVAVVVVDVDSRATGRKRDTGGNLECDHRNSSKLQYARLTHATTSTRYVFSGRVTEAARQHFPSGRWRKIHKRLSVSSELTRDGMTSLPDQGLNLGPWQSLTTGPPGNSERYFKINGTLLQICYRSCRVSLVLPETQETA